MCGFSYPRLTAARKRLENGGNTCKSFVSFKTLARRERAVTLCNLATQTRPVLDSSFFAPVLTLPHTICLHSAFGVLAFRISCRVIAVFVFRKPYLCLLHEYHVIYSVRYYPQFHVTAVGGCPWIRGRTCILLMAHFIKKFPRCL
jgi:hypothetical protein